MESEGKRMQTIQVIDQNQPVRLTEITPLQNSENS